MKYLLISGTRPEQIKLQPVIDEMKKRRMYYDVVKTGQHWLRDNKLQAGNDFFDIGRTLSSLIEKAKDYDAIIVQGDTTSALLGALAGLWARKKVIHIEAGLRSYDDRMIEEKIRRMIDHIADILFPPTAIAYDTLCAENVRGCAYVVGNTGIDAVKNVMKGMKRKEDHILVTMHRPENVDKRNILVQKLKAIERIQQKLNLPVVFPIHPRTEQKIQEFDIKLPSWKVYAPVTFKKNIELELGAKLVITDSGGIQEECCYLRKPTITIRKTTERPETIGLSNAIGDTDEQIEKAFNKVMKYKLDYKTCPYGEGDAAVKIVKVLCCQN